VRKLNPVSFFFSYKKKPQGGKKNGGGCGEAAKKKNLSRFFRDRSPMVGEHSRTIVTPSGGTGVFFAFLNASKPPIYHIRKKLSTPTFFASIRLIILPLILFPVFHPHPLIEILFR